MSTHQVQTALIAIACSAVTAVLISSVSAFADGDPSTDAVPKLIPYQGTLEQDGRAFTGDIEMTFKLYDADQVDPVWTETQTVSVFGGRFAVLLGSGDAPSGAALKAAIENADDLQLEIVLNDGTNEIPLGSKQRFVPVPYAYWTTASTNFVVADGALIEGSDNDGSTAALEVATTGTGQRMLIDGNEIDSVGDSLYLQQNSDTSVKVRSLLEADAGAQVSGPDNDGTDAALKLVSGGQQMLLGDNEIETNQSTLNLGTNNDTSVHVGNHLYVEGTDLQLGTADLAGRGDGGRALVQDSGDKLVINYNNDFSGGLTTGGTFYIQSTGDCDCEWSDFNSDGEHHCPTGKYIHAISQEEDCGSNDACVTRAFCCRVCAFGGY